MSETTTVNSTIDHLNRVFGVYAWRNNTGAVMYRRRLVRFGEPGAADIIGVRDGKFFAIEMKSKVGRQSEDQRRWQRKIEAAGGVYVLARSVAEALVDLGIFQSTPRKF